METYFADDLQCSSSMHVSWTLCYPTAEMMHTSSSRLVHANLMQMCLLCTMNHSACLPLMPLQAVDKNTLMQLRGNSAKGYAFDRRYGPEHNSDTIYDECVSHLVDNLFKVWQH